MYVCVGGLVGALQGRTCCPSSCPESHTQSQPTPLFLPGTEIAIVLDGSGSIEPEDFQRAKDFISNMMKNFYEKCFEVGFLEI